jgi:hypothetical protein
MRANTAKTDADKADQVRAEPMGHTYTAHAQVCGSKQSVFAGQQLGDDGQQGLLLCMTRLQSLRLHVLTQRRERATLTSHLHEEHLTVCTGLLHAGSIRP